MAYKIGIDIGGVITKYPDMFLALMRACAASKEFDIYIITDMRREDAAAMLKENGILDAVGIGLEKILCGDWTKDGDLCKTRLMEEHGIDIMVDDRLDYITRGVPLGLFVMPRPEKGYYADGWKFPDAREQRLEALAGELGYTLTKKEKV